MRPMHFLWCRLLGIAASRIKYFQAKKRSIDKKIRIFVRINLVFLYLSQHQMQAGSSQLISTGYRHIEGVFATIFVDHLGHPI